MYRKYALSIILCSLFLSGCSKNDNTVNPVIFPVPDISWIPIGLDSNMVVSLTQADNGNILAGTNYGLFISPDSISTWVLIDQPISSTIVTCFYKYAVNTILAGTSGNGVFISSDNGNRWIHIGLQGINITALAVSKTGRLFAATRGNGILVSDSADGEWQILNPAFNTQTFSSLLVTKNNTVFAGGTGVYRSEDNGSHWSLKNKGLGNWPVLSLIVDNSGRIEAGTDNGGFFWTADNGENWIKSNNGLTNTEITTLAVNTSGHIFAGTWQGGVFRSVDNGLNWTNVDSGLTIKMIHTLISLDDILYAGTFKGVFRSKSRTTNH